MYYIIFSDLLQKDLPKMPKYFNTRYNAEEFLLKCGLSEEDIDKNVIRIVFRMKG